MEWSDAAVQMLLDLLLEFRDWFTDRETDRDDNTIWEVRRMNTGHILTLVYDLMMLFSVDI